MTRILILLLVLTLAGAESLHAQPCVVLGAGSCFAPGGVGGSDIGSLDDLENLTGESFYVASKGASIGANYPAGASRKITDAASEEEGLFIGSGTDGVTGYYDSTLGFVWRSSSSTSATVFQLNNNAFFAVVDATGTPVDRLRIPEDGSAPTGTAVDYFTRNASVYYLVCNDVAGATVQYLKQLGTLACSPAISLVGFNIHQATSSGNIRNLYCLSQDDAPTGGSFVFTVMKGGAATSVSCTMAAGSSACNDSVNTAEVAAGDQMAIRMEETGPGSDSGVVQCNWEVGT